MNQLLNASAVEIKGFNSFLLNETILLILRQFDFSFSNMLLFFVFLFPRMKYTKGSNKSSP